MPKGCRNAVTVIMTWNETINLQRKLVLNSGYNVIRHRTRQLRKHISFHPVTCQYGDAEFTVDSKETKLKGPRGTER